MSHPPPPPPPESSKILILGAGTFGISTAYHLAKSGYSNIHVLDRADVPSPYSAGTDLNKIVRAEYEDPFYTDLALEAIQEWQKPPFAPYFQKIGYLVCTSAAAPEKSRNSLAESLSSISSHSAFSGSITELADPDAVRRKVPQLSGPLSGWAGYLNYHAGYAQAALVVEALARECTKLGVTFITGEEKGRVAELRYDSSGKCLGALTADQSFHTADLVIVCLGAHTASLIPQLGKQLTAKAWAVGLIQLTEEEAVPLRGIPVVNCRDLGFFFEPEPRTNVLKLCNASAGYTNRNAHGVSIPTETNEGIPEEDEIAIRRLLREALPQFADRPFVEKKICWCADTKDSDYIIDFVPQTSGLMVVSGDSGHGFKMLPIVGKWVWEFLVKGKRPEWWQWKNQELEGTGEEDISWRVGTVKDIKDVERQ
ncbi:AAA ATPase midasin [Saitoella coloradoensis]